MTIADIRHLFAYTDWANERVLSAAEKLPPEQLLRDVQISHTSILGTLLHVAGADWLWLERWRGNSPVGDDVWAGWKPGDARSLQQVQEKWQTVAGNRKAYLETVSDADLDREFAYIHLQKRPLPSPIFNPSEMDGFLITPDGFFPYNREPLTEADYQKYNHSHLRSPSELWSMARRSLRRRLGLGV